MSLSKRKHKLPSKEDLTNERKFNAKETRRAATLKGYCRLSETWINVGEISGENAYRLIDHPNHCKRKFLCPFCGETLHLSNKSNPDNYAAIYVPRHRTARLTSKLY